MSQPFWFTDPSVLFAKDTWYIFVPQPTMPVRTALNAIVRFSVYLAVLLTATTLNPWYLLMIPVVMGVSIVLHRLFPEVKKMTEGFVSGPVVSGYRGEGESMPSVDNPFMNPQLTDIHSDYNQPPAADITRIDVRDKVNEAFAQTSNIYMDTTDVFQQVQSQRNFYSVPADDHGGFLRFLGKNEQYSNQKGLSEGYVVAKGTVSELATAEVTTAPKGVSPSTSR
jgi:hypothetical protein